MEFKGAGGDLFLLIITHEIALDSVGKRATHALCLSHCSDWLLKTPVISCAWTLESLYQHLRVRMDYGLGQWGL